MKFNQILNDLLLPGFVLSHKYTEKLYYPLGVFFFTLAPTWFINFHPKTNWSGMDHWTQRAGWLSKHRVVSKLTREQFWRRLKLYFNLKHKEKKIYLFPSWFAEAELQNYCNRVVSRPKWRCLPLGNYYNTHLVKHEAGWLKPARKRKKDLPSPLFSLYSLCPLRHPRAWLIYILFIPCLYWQPFWMQAYTTLLESSAVTARNQITGKLGPGTPLLEMYPKNKNSQKLYAKVYSIIKTMQKTQIHTQSKCRRTDYYAVIKYPNYAKCPSKDDWIKMCLDIQQNTTKP